MEALAEQDVDTVSSPMLENKAIALHIGGDGLRRSVDSSSDKLIKAMADDRGGEEEYANDILGLRLRCGQPA